ncbi:hypothetical protein KIL84_016876 [Mauremys mutica]|uniref:Uncharacterized protein n=1 Tax=Mauremys mutica TaxID=74926 RepID=A0A9D4AR56_9SAUR|nr:hypothetical protein KIL84_016876 [Mauremys mutica]
MWLLPYHLSLFAQITRRGKNVDIHNHPTEATIGIVSTDNKLPLPNIMLIARPVPMQNGQVPSGCRTEQLVLTRDNLSVQILASEEEEEEEVVPGSQNKAQEDAAPEEKGQEQVDNAASPLGESSSRVSLAQGPSTETKPELNSESNEHESLTQSDVVRHEGYLGEKANSSSLHSSTAVDQARENTAVSVLSDTTAKDSNTSSQASVKGRCSSLKIVTLFSAISKTLLRKGSEEEKTEADHG